jgi:N-acetylglucosaminyl-diphospho-decaprenol L-rhamnosyltransferase
VRPGVSALIVSYNTRDLLLEAVESVANAPETETIVVDNASHDGSADAVAERFSDVRVLRSDRNLGFAGGTNLAARHASGEYLLLLNPDAALAPGALEQLANILASHSRAAAVGPTLRYPNGQPQAAAFRFPGLAQVWLDLFPVQRLTDSRLNGRVMGCQPVRVDHLLGACMLIRHAAWEDVGPLDEGYFMYLEEIDWCRRARQQGWDIWYQPAAVAVHHAGAATRKQPDAMFAQLWRSRLRYYQRFYDPTYNRIVRALVRVGLRAAARRTDNARANALDSVRALTR